MALDLGRLGKVRQRSGIYEAHSRAIYFFLLGSGHRLWGRQRLFFELIFRDGFDVAEGNAGLGAELLIQAVVCSVRGLNPHLFSASPKVIREHVFLLLLFLGNPVVQSDDHFVDGKVGWFCDCLKRDSHHSLGLEIEVDQTLVGQRTITLRGWQFRTAEPVHQGNMLQRRRFPHHWIRMELPPCQVRVRSR